MRYPPHYGGRDRPTRPSPPNTRARHHHHQAPSPPPNVVHTRPLTSFLLPPFCTTAAPSREVSLLLFLTCSRSLRHATLGTRVIHLLHLLRNPVVVADPSITRPHESRLHRLPLLTIRRTLRLSINIWLSYSFPHSLFTFSWAPVAGHSDFNHSTIVLLSS